MTFTSKDVKKIAHLARIKITDSDVNALQKDLSNIMRLVDDMDKSDTAAIEPLAHPLDETQPLREDVVTEPDQRELFQSIAPQTQNALYVVPQVMDSE